MASFTVPSRARTSRARTTTTRRPARDDGEPSSTASGTGQVLGRAGEDEDSVPCELCGRLLSASAYALHVARCGRDAERDAADERKRLRKEQDALLEESLRADRAKEAAHKEAELNALEAREREELDGALAASSVLRAQEARESKRQRVEPEPDDDADGCVHLTFRAADGTRVSRRFPRAAPAGSVFDFVESAPECGGIDAAELSFGFPLRRATRAGVVGDSVEVAFEAGTLISIASEW